MLTHHGLTLIQQFDSVSQLPHREPARRSELTLPQVRLPEDSTGYNVGFDDVIIFQGSLSSVPVTENFSAMPLPQPDQRRSHHRPRQPCTKSLNGDRHQRDRQGGESPHAERLLLRIRSTSATSKPALCMVRVRSRIRRNDPIGWC